MPKTKVTISATFKNNRKATATTTVAGTAIKLSNLINAKRELVEAVGKKAVAGVAVIMQTGRRKEVQFAEYASANDISLKDIRKMKKHLKKIK